MVELSTQTLSILAVVGAAGVAVLLVTVVFLAFKLARLRRAYTHAVDGASGESLFEAMQRQSAEVGQLRADLETIHGNTEHLREVLRGTVSRVGVVRYDAFEDMGGALSFSAALLDERADGVVFSAINGRTETRTYAKPIDGGNSEYNLSPEEIAAVDAALAGKKGVTASVPTKRRRRALA